MTQRICSSTGLIPYSQTNHTFPDSLPPMFPVWATPRQLPWMYAGWTTPLTPSEGIEQYEQQGHGETREHDKYPEGYVFWYKEPTRIQRWINKTLCQLFGHLWRHKNYLSFYDRPQGPCRRCCAKLDPRDYVGTIEDYHRLRIKEEREENR
jgi:hypothetical protein